MSDDVIKKSFGAIFSPKDIRDYKLKDTVASAINFPQTFRLVKMPVKNQEDKPTCVAFSLAGLIEYHNKKETGKNIRFSTDFIYGNREADDYRGDGMVVREALKSVQKYGDVTYADMPGNNNVNVAISKVSKQIDVLKDKAYPNRISTYFKIKSISDLKYALFNYGPVVAGMLWYDGADIDKNNVYQYDVNNSYSAHAVLIVGWDKDYIIVQNSWGRNWGDNGYFKIPISEYKNIIYEAYGITDDIVNISKPNIVVKKLSPLINAFLNFNK